MCAPVHVHRKVSSLHACCMEEALKSVPCRSLSAAVYHREFVCDTELLTVSLLVSELCYVSLVPLIWTAFHRSLDRKALLWEAPGRASGSQRSGDCLSYRGLCHHAPGMWHAGRGLSEMKAALSQFLLQPGFFVHILWLSSSCTPREGPQVLQGPYLAMKIVPLPHCHQQQGRHCFHHEDWLQGRGANDMAR